MAGLCPYLGLDDNPNDVLLAASQNHRCYVRRRPERVGNGHQVAVCLTSSYRRCPRLLSVARRHERQAAQPAEPARARVRAPRRRASRPKGITSRRLTFTEVLVATLAAGIVLSFAFVGYAAFYRSRVGPGLAAATAVMQDGVVPGAELPPTWPPVLPTSPPTAVSELAEPTPAFEQTVPVAVTEQAEPGATAVISEPLAAGPTPLLPTATVAARPPAGSPPTRLVIPAIDLDIPVSPVQVVQVGDGARARAVWGALPDAGGFHYTSAYPGNPGNTVINGHRDIQGAVFRHLDQVEVGDAIGLYVGETAYPYVATDILVVPETFASAKQRAENLRLIGTMPEERLTLITCTPVGLATHRLLVIAEPVDPGELVGP